MMVLVIRRSNERHVSLTCEHFGEYRSGKKKVSEDDQKEATVVIRESRSKKSGCTFELYGLRMKKKPGVETQKWILNVLSGQHNHKLPTTFLGHPYMGRMTPEEQCIIRNAGEIFTRPRDIIAQLRKKNPENVTSTKQVANYLRKMQYEDRGEMMVTQW